jgi:hypothetical protein
MRQPVYFPRRLYCGILGGLLLAGCGGYSDKPVDTPTVDSFTGRLTHNGQPVDFPEGAKVRLNLFRLGAGDTWGIPISADGTFNIGWMPIGRYSGNLQTTLPAPSGERRNRPPSMHTVPEFEIQAGQTEYTIDLGDNWKS